MDAQQTAQQFLDRLNATTTETERRTVAAEFHAYLDGLSPEDRQQAKLVFKPRLDELKARIAEVEEEVAAQFKRRLQTHD